ncbi:hypothetical protein EJF18_40081 [Clavispora lusitaniae]|uniref:Uncharacterized protein n=2 Tax=Clavispora lusitaniae TaxID=36911 RepID=C4Y543_CLAL4|nr:uncharacterized protein CLUG_03277 [Clavispora lusitaniae ATCC 42720]QFZ28058.1 hypothetical protein EJF14_40081 [Clavispora lusitaniae]EEQ39149.1 hypothetical protein CLUG_03277 [Clavispora lusitaniae ATCC 42720]QFZ33721.1 hypothetical protein EJF16_40081 [Clavispora lusitaniae]QFZ39405.1 hypothetical protein EJF15_40081 [Clavispora lusitaniae]QFZ45087.1 hypothetical protein EJF18_40081 [Clavispora lusitaniae]
MGHCQGRHAETGGAPRPADGGRTQGQAQPQRRHAVPARHHPHGGGGGGCVAGHAREGLAAHALWRHGGAPPGLCGGVFRPEPDRADGRGDDAQRRGVGGERAQRPGPAPHRAPPGAPRAPAHARAQGRPAVAERARVGAGASHGRRRTDVPQLARDRGGVWRSFHAGPGRHPPDHRLACARRDPRAGDRASGAGGHSPRACGSHQRRRVCGLRRDSGRRALPRASHGVRGAACGGAAGGRDGHGRAGASNGLPAAGAGGAGHAGVVCVPSAGRRRRHGLSVPAVPQPRVSASVCVSRVRAHVDLADALGPHAPPLGAAAGLRDKGGDKGDKGDKRQQQRQQQQQQRQQQQQQRFQRELLRASLRVSCPGRRGARRPLRLRGSWPALSHRSRRVCARGAPQSSGSRGPCGMRLRAAERLAFGYLGLSPPLVDWSFNAFLEHNQTLNIYFSGPVVSNYL